MRLWCPSGGANFEILDMRRLLEAYPCTAATDSGAGIQFLVSFSSKSILFFALTRQCDSALGFIAFGVAMHVQLSEA
jgi:hypothetical protein